MASSTSELLCTSGVGPLIPEATCMGPKILAGSE